MELCGHSDLTDHHRITLLRHTLKGNSLRRYRSLTREIKQWKEINETFLKFFLTTESKERNYNKFASFKLGEIM